MVLAVHSCLPYAARPRCPIPLALPPPSAQMSPVVDVHPQPQPAPSSNVCPRPPLTLIVLRSHCPLPPAPCADRRPSHPLLLSVTAYRSTIAVASLILIVPCRPFQAPLPPATKARFLRATCAHPHYPHYRPLPPLAKPMRRPTTDLPIVADATCPSVRRQWFLYIYIFFSFATS